MSAIRHVFMPRMQEGHEPTFLFSRHAGCRVLRVRSSKLSKHGEEADKIVMI